jgi:hypothetical protein
MKSSIQHKKTEVVRKTISIPEEVFALSAGKAALFPDYSKYVQDLIQRDAKGELSAQPAQQQKAVAA